MIRLIQLDNDEEWKVKVEKLNRNLTQGEKLTKEKIQEKVRTIYSSEKGKERCLMSLIMPGEPSWFKGIKLDTKLGNALLVKVFKEDMVGDIDLSPEKLEEFDRMRIEAEKSNLSLISFSTIKSAIKEHLLGKGER